MFLCRRAAARIFVRAAIAAGALSLACVGRAAEPGATATPADAPKATALFNGRDLTGWAVFLKDSTVDPTTVWSVKDGVLRLTGVPSGYVHTTESYSNYRLHVEWRWPVGAAPKSNSGVFVHLHGKDAVWPPAVECQLAAGNAGQLVGNDVALPGAPIINKKPRAPKFAASSEKPFGEWNSYDIICSGRSIDLTVNGVHQNHVDGVSIYSGFIGLQMEGYPIEFRNIQLVPLP